MGIKFSFMQMVKTGLSGITGKKLKQGPIPIPTEVLEEIFSFLPRSERARLVFVSRQAADTIIPGVNAEREKVSPSLLHRCGLLSISHCSLHSSFSPLLHALSTATGGVSARSTIKHLSSSVGDRISRWSVLRSGGAFMTLDRPS